jgi:chromosome segregation ATPase
MSQTKEVFVLIPFTQKFNKVYEQVISPACTDLGYEVSKADSTNTSQNILRDIIEGISNADLLIADLTNSNPNVFYEAGVAHGLGTPTILITQSIDSVPFDLQAYHMIEYSTEFDEIGEFESELTDIAEKHLDDEMEFGSPVSDFADSAIRGATGSDTEYTETDEDSEPDISDEHREPTDNQQKGLFDYAEEAEQAQSALMNDIDKISKGMEELESKLSVHIEEVNSMAESEERVSPQRVNRLSKNAAGDIRRYAKSISESPQSIDESLKLMMDAEESFIKFADATYEEHREQLTERQRGLSQYRAEASSAIEGLEEFNHEMTQLRGLNQQLTSSVDELSTIISDLISTLSESESRAERMIQLIEKELQKEM